MLSQKMERALNDQINAELYSSYLYLSMSAYFASVDLNGCAHWMRLQAQEELTHAMKFFDYLSERDGRPKLAAVAEPQFEWDSPMAVFQATYEHEQHVTKLINTLMDLALSESDHATVSTLKWFIDEQVEEESNVKGILQRFKLLKDAPGGLFMMDNELAQRVLSAPVE